MLLEKREKNFFENSFAEKKYIHFSLKNYKEKCHFHRKSYVKMPKLFSNYYKSEKFVKNYIKLSNDTHFFYGDNLSYASQKTVIWEVLFSG